MTRSCPEPQLIGQLLLREGLIRLEALEKALLEQEKSGLPLGEVLIKSGDITQEAFYEVLSRQTGLAYVRLKDLTVTPAILAEIPAKFACHYAFMPVGMEDSTVTVAVPRLLDIQTQDDIRLLLKKNIKMVLASPKEIAEAIKTYYGVGAQTMEKISPQLAQEKFTSVQSQETQDLVASSEDASIIQFVNQILLQAYHDRATDIHIEPYENELAVRYRIDQGQNRPG
ncbi:MAG: hypothetical protein HY209_01110 [Candidatus Omnitrophica bacterium]|nr:hypothetical protein [Candidatus Omnitrophota bacterium]